MDTLQRLDQILRDRGWSRYRLARECGINESTIANIFKRKAMPSIPTLEMICKGFGISMAQFFAEDEMVEMTPELKELFDEWVLLSPEQKAATLAMVRAFKQNKRDE